MMNTNYIKAILLVTAAVGMLGIMTLGTNTAVRVKADGDLTADYKKNCAACHTAKAEKFFDPAKTDEEHVQVVLKGKKGEKPPYMPGFEAKGMTAEQAKAYVDYMRTLRKPADGNTNTATAR